MSVFGIINFDRVAMAMLDDLEGALRGWLKGFPQDESAFMNQLTGRLSRGRSKRACDVGIENPVVMTSELAPLHRRGDGQVDAYGADLAVTVDVPGARFLKTAFFQLKKSSDLTARFEKKQIEDARAFGEVWDRSFAMVFDPNRLAVRLHDIKQLAFEFDSNHKTQQFRCHDWLGATRWLWRWLDCDIGPPSKHGDPNGVENLLENFRVPDSPFDRASGPTGDFAIPDEWLPARSWLQFGFTLDETDKSIRLR